ncbi:hypothetical protein BC749_102918 [Flavobacterium araucananum]|nr:hypothetical protein BC749_102918 [Flavobacterium araucananum]
MNLDQSNKNFIKPIPIMKKKLLLFSPLLLCMYANAQDNEQTDKQKIEAAIADKFSFARIIDVKYTQFLPADFDSELYDKDFVKGRIKNKSKFNAIVNLPIIMKPTWNLTGSAEYKYEAADLEQVKDYNGIPQSTFDKKYDFHYLSAALSFTYFATLFEKTIIYNASLIVDGTEKDPQRIKGLVGASIVLKATEKTIITVGVIVFADPTSTLPLFPTFSLEHHFASGWVADIVLPQRIYFTHNIFSNGRLSLGSELITDGFYMQPQQSGLSKVFDYRQMEVKSGLTYEHWLAKDLIATFKVGVSNVFNSRLTERGKSTNDYILDTKQDGMGYFSLGFSFNPFTKKKK